MLAVGLVVDVADEDMLARGLDVAQKALQNVGCEERAGAAVAGGLQRTERITIFLSR